VAGLEDNLCSLSGVFGVRQRLLDVRYLYASDMPGLAAEGRWSRRRRRPRVWGPVDGATAPMSDTILRITGPATGIRVTDVTTGGWLSYPATQPAASSSGWTADGWMPTLPSPSLGTAPMPTPPA
jgi:hypothetical protein